MTGAEGRTPRAGVARNIAGAVIGNALEWYDVLIYAYFATVLGRLFFPADERLTSTILVFATFGLSFVVRPLGGIVVGSFADRRGRRAALVLASLMMCGGTAVIALLPTYERIGVAAPVLLVFARLVQGFSAGGEFGSATAYLSEQASRRPGLVASLQFASQGVGMLMAATCATVLTAFLSEAEIAAWGWRLPFLFGTLIGPVAYVVRRHASESPEFEAARATGALERPDQPGTLAAAILVAAGLVSVGSVGAYFLIYMPSYATGVMGLPPMAGFVSSIVAAVVLIVVTPLSGLLADRLGFLPVATGAACGLLLLPIPLLAHAGGAAGMAGLVVIQACVATLLAGYFGALPILLVRLFNVRSRTLGLSIGYNLAVMTLGGFAPLIFAVLQAVYGGTAPAIYLSGVALLSLAALITVAYRARERAADGSAGVA